MRFHTIGTFWVDLFFEVLQGRGEIPKRFNNSKFLFFTPNTRIKSTYLIFTSRVAFRVFIYTVIKSFIDISEGEVRIIYNHTLIKAILLFLDVVFSRLWFICIFDNNGISLTFSRFIGSILIIWCKIIKSNSLLEFDILSIKASALDAFFICSDCIEAILLNFLHLSQSRTREKTNVFNAFL